MEEVTSTVALLKRNDAMAYTTVVAAPEGASLGERYAAISSALAIGELVRDRGGHSLVIIDDLACMVRAQPLPSLQSAHRGIVSLLDKQCNGALSFM